MKIDEGGTAIPKKEPWYVHHPHYEQAGEGAWPFLHISLWFLPGGKGIMRSYNYDNENMPPEVEAKIKEMCEGTINALLVMLKNLGVVHLAGTGCQCDNCRKADAMCQDIAGQKSPRSIDEIVKDEE